MTYEEAIIIAERLRTHYDSAFSSSERDEISTLYEAVLARKMKITNCQRCYHDALIEIICFLKKEKRMAERSKYVMRAGFIIHSPEFENGKIYTNDNLTDDVADRFMAQFPNTKKMFDLRKDFAPKAEKPVEVVNTTQKPKKRSTRKKNVK